MSGLYFHNDAKADLKKKQNENKEFEFIKPKKKSEKKNRWLKKLQTIKSRKGKIVELQIWMRAEVKVDRCYFVVHDSDVFKFRFI